MKLEDLDSTMNVDSKNSISTKAVLDKFRNGALCNIEEEKVPAIEEEYKSTYEHGSPVKVGNKDVESRVEFTEVPSNLLGLV